MIVLDPINILGHDTYENKIIIKVKNHNPSKGEKGHSKGEKGHLKGENGELVRRLLRGKF